MEERARCLTSWVSPSSRGSKMPGVFRVPSSFFRLSRLPRTARVPPSFPIPPRPQLTGFSGMDETELVAYRDGSILLCVVQDV